MRALGIDLGGTSIKCGIVENGKIIAFKSCKTREDSNFTLILKDILEVSKALIGEVGAIERIGIGSPGLIDSQTGVVGYSNNIKWDNAPLAAKISESLNTPCFIANDAKCASLGEALFGAGVGYNRVAMLTLGTGVGGGYVRDGKLDLSDIYAGAESIFGHMTIESGGRLCSCGKRGCLESYASATALTDRYKNLFGAIKSAKEIFDEARRGDDDCVKIVREFNKYLGDGVVSIANILRPQVIVIGGGVSAASDLIIEELNGRLKNEVYGYSYAKVYAAAARLGNDAGIYGAAALEY